MLQQVTFRLQIQSLNKTKYANRFQLWGQSKAEKAATSEALGHLSRPTAEAAPFKVTLCRISPGFLDDDNIRSGFKSVRDTIAEWCSVDDGDSRVIRWEYAQSGCPLKEFAAAITIEDQREGDGRKVILPGVPARLGAAHLEKTTTRPNDVPKPPKAQLPLPLKQNVYIEFPWLQNDVHRIVRTPFEIHGEPPASLRFMVPTAALACEATARLSPGSAAFFRRTERRTRGGDVVFVYTWEK